MLCGECARLFNSPWRNKLGKKKEFRGTNLYGPEILKQSSCEFCAFLAACPTQSINHWSGEGLLPSARQYEIELFGNPILENRLRILDLDVEMSGTMVNLSLSRMSDLTRHSVIPQTVSTTSTRPESSLPRIHAWLNQCNIHHEFCGQLRHRKDAAWHPTRLVDVSQELLRLEDNSKHLAGAKYTTMSYCWGPDPRFEKLQQSSYDNFKNGIIFSNLPGTLQDAVVFTQSLNIQYVWIDALCIIQDSTGNEDWLRESLTMSQVYGHSYLNIAASSSATADDGLFRERNPIELNGISVRSPDHPDEEYFISQPKHWFYDFQFQPLNLRAWALQERRLSSRTIHFSQDQIYWECSQLCASEIFPDGKPWDSQWSHRQKQIAKARENAESSDRFEAWWWLVWEYSKGSLTQKSDRLVAIAGLAKSFATSKDQYFAGHWRNDMPHGLTWHVAEASRGFKKTDLAPTWSWASIPDGKTVCRPSERSLYSRVDILDVKSETIGDQFGPVTSGLLRLRGSMFKATISLAPPEIVDFFMRKYTLRFSYNGLMIKFVRLDFDDDDDAVCEGQIVFCMEIEGEVDCKPKGWIPIMPYVMGLLLSSTGRMNGEFKRVGCYICELPYSPNRKLKKAYYYLRDYARMHAAFRQNNISPE